MNTVLLYSLAFTSVSTFGLIYFSYKIWRLKVTPPYTWALFLVASLVQAVRTGRSFTYLADLSTWVSTFPASALIIGFGLNTIESLLIFIFVVKVYYGLKSKFPRTP